MRGAAANDITSTRTRRDAGTNATNRCGGPTMRTDQLAQPAVRRVRHGPARHPRLLLDAPLQPHLPPPQAQRRVARVSEGGSGVPPCVAWQLFGRQAARRDAGSWCRGDGRANLQDKDRRSEAEASFGGLRAAPGFQLLPAFVLGEYAGHRHRAAHIAGVRQSPFHSSHGRTQHTLSRAEISVRCGRCSR